MNSDRLSERLYTVASYIPEGSILADIGSDHAYLPCYAVRKGLAAQAVAGEVSTGPWTSAYNQVKEEGLSDRISVRKGDGLEVVEPDEVTCVTIAGMGGTLIANILDRGKEKLGNVKRLILQPNIQAVNIRLWLLQNGWELIDEAILEEDGKIYEVLVAEKGQPENPYSEQRESELLLGPFLKKECNEVFRKKWKTESAHWENIIRQLEKGGKTESSQQKMAQLQSHIQFVEEALTNG